MASQNLSLSRVASRAISISEQQEVRDYLTALKADAVAAAVAAGVAVHHAGVLTNAVANVPAIPVSLAECVTFVNTMKTEMNAHLASATVHVTASAESIAAAAATDQGSADVLAAELVADYNTHLVEASVHISNDAVNAAVDSTDGSEAQLIATCTGLRAKYLAHIVITMNAGFVA